MDSGSAVPTLRPGLSETVAAKLLTVASGRCGEAAEAALATSWRGNAGAEAAEFMLLRSAFLFAELRAGRRSEARIANTAMTTSSSISVNAPRRRFPRVDLCDKIDQARGTWFLGSLMRATLS